MRRLLIACLLFGCKGKPPTDAAAPSTAPPPTPSTDAAQSAKADPWAKVDAGVDTPDTRRKRAEAALGRVGQIKPKLAAIRELEFSRDVPTEYQNAADFKAFVHRETVKDLPPDKDKNVSAALFHIGLLQKPVDLAEVEEQAVTTQAGAYYDPATKKFFLVMVPDNELALDTISAHELTHALQDQHFDLDKYAPATLTDDQSNARRFIVEGDATFAMFLYALGKPKVDPGIVKLLHAQIETFAGMDLDAFKQQTRDQAKAFIDVDPEIKKSVEAMDLIPPTVLVPMLDSYMKGAVVVMTAYEHGGWKAVNDLFRNPPDSTEQVLHPATKMYPTRDKPHAVTLAKLDGYTELTNNVLGELEWQIYFSLWKPALAKDASEGWGGDRYTVVRRTDGRLIGVMATTWDTPADATQFAEAYLQTLPVRFPGVVAKAGEPFARPNGGKIFVKIAGSRVFVVDGADDAKLLDQVMRTTKID